MPLFGKKKQNDEQPTKSVGAKNRADLTQMFDESVPESIRAQLRENEPFKVGDHHYAILILDLDKYGFKAISKKNTAQGEFIEYTKNGSINAYVPASGYLDGDNELKKEIVGIIPNSVSLGNIEEIATTREAEYTLALLDENLETTFINTTVTFDDIMAVSDEDKSILDFIPEDIVKNLTSDKSVEEDNGADASDDMDEDDDDDAEVEEYEDDDEEFEDYNNDNLEDENYDDSGSDEYDESPVDTEDTGDDFVDDIDMDFNGNDESDEYDEEDEDEDDEESEEEMSFDDDDIIDRPLPGVKPQSMSYTEDEVNAAYSRKFYSEDLGIEISSEPFDTIFANRNPFKHFDDNRDETGEHAWLNKQLNQQARDANHQLDTLHAENLQEMRARYIQTISRFCDDIVRDVDPENKNTKFYAKTQSLLRQKQQIDDNSEATIQKMKDEQIQKFENSIKSVRDRAADEAENSFRNKFTAQHEKELAEIANKYKRDIEASYHEQQQAIHNERREEAKRKLDTAITETLAQIEKEYNEALRGYNELYEQFAKSLEHTYEKYREDEIARAKALATELAQNDLVAKTQQECTARIENIKSEYDIKSQNLEDEKNKVIAAANERVEYMGAQCKERIDDERRRVENLQQKLDDMAHDVKIEGERKDREYEARIGELKQENKIWIEKFDTLDAATKRQHVLASVLVVAIAIVMIAIGFIIGMYSGLNRASNNNNSSNTRIVSEVNTDNLGE